MIGVKEAVAAAKRFLAEMYEEEDLVEVRLEEVELVDEGHLWHVTLSFLRQSTPVEAELGFWAGREMKLVKVSRETGEITSMKIMLPKQP